MDQQSIVLTLAIGIGLLAACSIVTFVLAMLGVLVI